MFDVSYLEDTQTQDNKLIVGTLAATIWYELTNFLNNTATFEVMIKNNSSGGQSGRIVSFGFDNLDPFDPTINSASANNSWNTELGPNIEAPFNEVDLCIYIGNNCNGGGGSGVTPGNTDTTTLSVTYDAGTNLAGGIVLVLL